MNWPFVCLPVKSVWHIHPELSIPNYPSISSTGPYKPEPSIQKYQSISIQNHSFNSIPTILPSPYISIHSDPSISIPINQTIFPSPPSIPNNPSNSIPNHPSISIPNHMSISIPNHPSISYPNHPFISIPNHLSISIPNQIIHPFPFQIKSSIPISPKPLIQIHL